MFVTRGHNQLTPVLRMAEADPSFRKGQQMRGEYTERWQEVCAEILDEKDPQRLTALATELNGLLEAREQRRKQPLSVLLINDGSGTKKAEG